MPRRRTIWLLAGLVIGIGAGGGMGSLATMFSSLPSFENTPSPAADLMRRYGCAGCHQVPAYPRRGERSAHPLKASLIVASWAASCRTHQTR